MPPGRATSYDHTVDALNLIVERCAADEDRVGYFAVMYLAVTHTVLARSAQGRFADPARMELFVTSFALGIGAVLIALTFRPFPQASASPAPVHG